MVHGLLLGDPVIGIKYLVVHIGLVILEGIHLRDIPLKEHLKLMDIDKLRRVGDDLVQETLILLVTAELPQTE